MRRVVAMLAVLSLPARAFAGPDDAQSALIGTMVGLGTVGALTSGIAAAVYAVEGRAFTTPWVVVSLFSAAMCAGMAIGLAGTDRIDAGPVLAVLYAGLAAWPAAWSVRSSLNPAGFGAPLDAPEPAPKRQVALSVRF
jgi:hypothetical protein